MPEDYTNATLPNTSLDDLPNEAWKNIVGLEGYFEVSDKGRVKRLARTSVTKNGKIVPYEEAILVGESGPYGHKLVTMTMGKRRIRIQIHRLVLETFVGPCPPGMECRHLNGDPRDNRVENLKWGTHTENMRDKGIHGTHSRGNRSHFANGNLDDEKVESLIRTWESEDTPLRELAQKFGISYGTVSCILRNVSWRHIRRNKIYRPKKYVRSNIDVGELYRLHATGKYSQSELAKMLNVSGGIVWHYLNKLKKNTLPNNVLLGIPGIPLGLA